MFKFSLTSKKDLEADIKINISTSLTIVYKSKENIIEVVDPRDSSRYPSNSFIKIIPGKKIENSSNSNELSPYYVCNNYFYMYTAEPDLKISMALFKILRKANWEWRKQFNQNIGFFNRGFKSYNSLFRTFVFLMRCPALILSIPELKTDKLLKTSTAFIRIENFDGTNLNDIFGKNKKYIKLIKNNKELKQYQLQYGIKFSNDYNWPIEKSVEILKFFKSSDFSTVYVNGMYRQANKYQILDKLAYQYTYEKIYNYISKIEEDSSQSSYLYSQIIDTWNMIEELKLLDGGKIPLIAVDRIIEFHDTINEYYLTKISVDSKEAKSFKRNVLKSSRYMDLVIDDYTFKVIQSRDELNLEGYKQSHCVASYYNRVDNGESVIVTMRKVSRPDIPVITIEAHTRGKNVIIYQSSGKHNRSPSSEESKVIDKWTKKSTSKLEELRNKELEDIKKENPITLENILKSIKK